MFNQYNIHLTFRGFEKIADWVQSTVSHFWWSLQSCDATPIDFKERFQPLIYHCINMCGASENEGKVTLKFRHAMAWRTPSQKFVARKVLRKKNWHYMKDMLKDTIKRATVGIKRKKSVKGKVMAATERDRTKLIEMGIKYARFI